MAEGQTYEACARSEPQQGYQVLDRLAYFAIDDDVVELLLGGHFCLRGFQPPLPLSRRLGAAPDQPPTEFLPRRRRQEDESSLGQCLPHLPSPLEVDFQQRVSPRGERLEHWCFQGAISVRAVHDSPLEQGVLRD